MPPSPPTAHTAAPAAAARPRVSHALAGWALALLLGLQPATTDIYLPALPLLTRDLSAPMSGAQLTMSALMLAFGIAQLVWGPVADRVGRRPVLLAGLSAYVVASVASALAGSIEALVAWRAVQGAAMAAAVVCARAIVRDLYEPAEGAKVMSLGLSGLGLIAISGPAIGGLVAAAWGWRAVLGVVAAIGVATLFFVILRLPETLRQRNPHATAAGPLLAAWSRIGRHPVFVAWTLLTSCTYGGLFTLLAGSSFVYMDVLGVPAAGYGLAMASSATSYLAGTFVCRRWIPRLGIERTVRRASGFTLAGGIAMAALALAGVQSVWAVLLPQWAYMFAHGIHQPCGQAGAVGPFPQSAGAASALSGFVLALVAFGIGAWLGRAIDGTVMPMALGVGFWALATGAVALVLVQRLPRAGASERPA
jgi:DHA1 family bicyclomycin/chloramphenicol resistance-like MFS transporter